METYEKLSETEMKVTETTTAIKEITVTLSALLQAKSDMLNNISRMDAAYQVNRQKYLDELAAIEARITEAKKLVIKEVADAPII